MKNIPQKIYLQIGDECPDDADFKMLEGVTWCTEREFNNDIPFVLHKTDVSGALAHPVAFGRWLLKNCEPVWEGPFLTWSYQGKGIDTIDLYRIFNALRQ